MVKETQSEEDNTEQEVGGSYPSYLNEMDSGRSEVVKELFDFQTETDLITKTETPPSMIIPLVMVETAEYAIQPNRKQTLGAFFRMRFDLRMLSVGRKSRKEIVLTQRKGKEEVEDELGI